MTKKKTPLDNGERSSADEKLLRTAVAVVSERYTEGADVVSAAFEVAEEFGVSPNEILSRLGQRGGNVAARNRRRAPPRTAPTTEASESSVDDERDEEE